jgi:CheY-like chemotaxis protein/two-component sensor histidine kinase
VLDDAGRDRAGRAIYMGAQRQAELINELLDVARIMSHKLQLELTIVDLRDVVRSAVDIVQPNADTKRIDIGIEEDPMIGMVCGDSGRLHQVATNLLANAVKFTPEGGEIHVRLQRVDDMVEMVVADSGQGISPDFLPWVFEPFRQADAATTRVHGGLGLGLSIVRHLVEAHGGTVQADSRGKGKGATFTVRLPVATLCGDEVEGIAADLSSLSELEDETDELEGISVLVVDDDDESRLVVAAHLENHHARILTATSAAAALDILQREQVDVLLADVAMPGEDGYSLIRKLRAMPRTASIPAAALTAFARNEDRERALEAGFQLHMAKPIDVRSLVAAVAKLAKPVHS